MTSMSATFTETLRRTVTRLGPFMWLVAAAALMCACLAAFAKLTSEVLEGETGYDGVVATWLHTHATAGLTDVFRAITFLGNAETLLAVVVLATAAMLLMRRITDAAFVVLAFVGSSSINHITKVLVARDRPEFADPITVAHGYSFPSGHAMTSTVVYGMVAFLVIRALRSPKARAAVLGVLALLLGLMGLSRLYLGVHYLSDVGAGYLLGTAWLMLCLIGMSLASRAPQVRRIAGSWTTGARSSTGSSATRT